VLSNQTKLHLLEVTMLKTQTLSLLKLPCLLVIPVLSLFWLTPHTRAEDNCTYSLGESVTGASTTLNLCSIQWQRNRQVTFTYSLSNKQIEARANCPDNSWISFPDRSINRPRSKATSDMIKIVCTAPSFNEGIAIGVVFDPPSKIRRTPNGEVVCTIQDVTGIALAGGVTGDGQWYRTTVCGGGVIHQSQVRP